ncbi:MAG: YhfC family intramembrane metalloprotease [Paraburkholderia sp.]|jgi:uncharacterized membrane protein YhfC
MVVAPLTLTCLALATLFVAVLPIALYRRLRRPFGLNGRDTIAGIAVFALCAMVIERAVNGFVLHQAITAAWLSNPLTFVIYGALIAGVCQEVGRFIAMRLMWRRATAGNATAPHSVTGPSAAAGDAAANATAAKLARAARSRKTSVPSTGDSTALGYGIGHGGAEAWMVGVLVEIQWIVFAVVENRGQLDSYLDNVPVDSMMRIHLILASLSPQMAGIFVLERMASLVLQIGLSVLMWRGVRAGWRGILPLAIVAHALVEGPAALFQAKLVPLYAVDGLYALLALIVAGVLVRIFRSEAQVTQTQTPTRV